MEKKVFKTIVMITALSFLTGIASIAAATDAATTDNETQQHTTFQNRGEMKGMGYFHRGDNTTTGTEDLSETQIEELQAERTAFQTATRDLRMEIQSKRLALKSELAKKGPDVEAAKSLQKDISTLAAELAQKRIEHIVAMKKIAPYAGMSELQSETELSQMPRGKRNT